MSRIASIPSNFAVALLMALLAMPFLPGRAAAASDDDYQDLPPSRVGRISRLDGDAAIRSAGSPDWQSVSANTPIFQGDEVFAGDRARLEIQLGGGRYLRMNERTEVVFASLDEDAVRVEMTTGTVVVSLRRLDGRERFEIAAPAAAVDIREEGVYRVDVDEFGATRVSVHKGRARVTGPERDVDVDEGASALFDYNDPSDVDLGYAAAWDGFDAWSRDLDEDYDQAYADSSGHVDSLGYRNDIYGLAELIRFGSWVDSGSYGSCWVPRVGYGWQPYSNGYWQYYPSYGYTWISYDPWGWAPFHYGRWAWLNGYGWAWVPWSQFSYGGYYWTPSQVYWCQYPGYGGYGYVPLAPNEPYVPYIAYERFGRRHRRDFVPEHLRAGRGIGLTQPGSGVRLKPARNDDGRVREVIGRGPVEAVPTVPRDTTPVKPRVVPSDTPRVKPRPVQGGGSRGPVVSKPADKPSADRPTADRPATDRPTARPAPKPRRDLEPTVVKPSRPQVAPRPREEQPRVKEPPAPRVEPRREPRAEPKPERTVDRSPRVERVQPAPRPERAQPAPSPKREKP
jgi:hypothetical protein